MTLAAPISLPAGAPEISPSAWSLLVASWRNVACLVVVGLYVLFAILSLTPELSVRAIEPLPPVVLADGTELTEYAPPSLADFPARLIGTDIQNRSVFYRTLYGCRTALTIALFTAAIALTIGVTLGVLAGYFGGVIDDLINWLIATVSAVPWILLVLALGFVLKGIDINVGGVFGSEPAPAAEVATETTAATAPATASTPTAVMVPKVVFIPELLIVILAMGLTDWVGVCRLIRGEVLKQRSLDYVAAGKALGLSQTRILFRHILPNCLHLVIITFTLSAVGYVQAEVALTFLGIGISDLPSWGRMIDDAKLELLRGVWWQFAAATLAIGLLCLCLSLLGDALRDVLDPKTRTRR